MPKLKPTDAGDSLRRLGLALEDLESSSTLLDAKHRKQVLAQIDVLRERMGALERRLDPIANIDQIFDPTHPRIAGQIIAITLLAQPRLNLMGLKSFYGSGIYALYYNGDFKPYQPIAGKDHPIYVGVASPVRRDAAVAKDQGPQLFKRLTEHVKSIRSAATTLSLNDFSFRVLVVQTGFELAAERQLIEVFQPVWNSETKVCFGIGKHGDASKTRVNKRSPWDTLHPGRKWADTTELNQKEPGVIMRELESHFQSTRLYESRADVLDSFFESMVQLRSG